MIANLLILTVLFTGLDAAAVIKQETGLNSMTDYFIDVYSSFYKGHCNNQGMPGPRNGSLNISGGFMGLPFPTVLQYTVESFGDFCSLRRSGDIQIINSQYSEVNIKAGFTFNLNISLNNVTALSGGDEKFNLDMGNIVVTNNVSVKFNDISFTFPSNRGSSCQSKYVVYFTMGDFKFQYDTDKKFDALEKWANTNKQTVFTSFSTYLFPSELAPVLKLCKPTFFYHFP